MKKNFLQDVVPSSQKRSIRDIPLPSHQKPRTSPARKAVPIKRESEPEQYEPVVETTYEAPEERVPEPDFSSYEEEEIVQQKPRSRKSDTQSYQKKPKKSVMKKIVIALCLGFIIFIGIFLSRTEAEISIAPKKSQANVSLEVPLDSKSPLVTQTQITKTVSRTLAATSEQQVEKQASGRIRIINTHKEGVTQELVKNTRFQTSEGLVYRIKDSIVVPGYTMSGSTIVPGTLEVDVYADSAGEEYNIGKTKFTIPGFQGREQFDKIIAESVSDMTGGYIGIRKVVSDDAKDEAQEQLEAELATQIQQNQNQTNDYVLVPDLQTLTFGELQDSASGDSVTLSLSGNVTAYSFAKKDLFSFIGQNSVEGATANDQFTVNGESLTFAIDGDGIAINGSTQVTWITDTEQLKKDFAGKKRSEAVSVLDSYRSLETAEPTLKPFWKTRFPSDVAKIEVRVQE